jgi:hypothetical protein
MATPVDIMTQSFDATQHELPNFRIIIYYQYGITGSLVG